MGDPLVDLWGLLYSMIGRGSRTHRAVDHHVEEVVRSSRGDICFA
jgi:hypothetical protein